MSETQRIDLAYGRGSSGFVVRRLQDTLNARTGAGLTVDGDFGGKTASAICEAQRRVGLPGDGQAGQPEFEALQVPWPDEFERSLNVVSEFEGTGFGGACGPANTGDDAGVTYGIVGFTSYNGELQDLARQMRDRAPAEFGLCLDESGADRDVLIKAMDRVSLRGDFGRFALEGGRVRGCVSRFLRALGDEPAMIDLQCGLARKRYWDRSQDDCARLFGVSANLRIRLLMFDLAVQNGGLGSSAVGELADLFGGNRLLSEREKAWMVIRRVLDRMASSGRPVRLREDVRSRKGAIVNGIGVVHGRTYRMLAYGV
jgi:hypothetical protein